MGDGTWTVGDGQSGSFGDSVSLTVLFEGGCFWTVGGVCSDNFNDSGISRVGETSDSGTS